MLQGFLFGSDYEVFSFGASDLQAMKVVENPDGSGDLIFREQPSGTKFNGKPVPKFVGFLGVNNVRDLEVMVRRTLGERAAHSAPTVEAASLKQKGLT